MAKKKLSKEVARCQRVYESKRGGIASREFVRMCKTSEAGDDIVQHAMDAEWTIIGKSGRRVSVQEAIREQLVYNKPEPGTGRQAVDKNATARLLRKAGVAVDGTGRVAEEEEAVEVEVEIDADVADDGAADADSPDDTSPDAPVVPGPGVN